ncbi:MAG: GAF domain-containing sensor histidine kinase [Cyanobacteria bacterium P01_F01_bin.13]
MPMAMDLKMVLGASKRLMGEIVLENLLIKMIKMILEISQATKGYMILAEEEGLKIAVVGRLYPHEDIQLQAIPVEDSLELPLSVIQQVSRTKSSVLSNTPASRREFIYDAYIQKHPSASIFCLPLLGKQDKLTAILYLENTKKNNHFSHKHIKLLQLMSYPAALCIDNAKLYKQLGDYSRSLETTIEDLHKARQISQGQTTALGNTLNALTQEPELDSFAEKVLAAVTQQLNAPSSVLWLYDAGTASVSHYRTYLGTSTLQESTAIAATPPIIYFPKGTEHPFWQRLIGKIAPVHIPVEHEQALEPEWRRWLAAQNVRSLLVLPALIEENCLGFLNIWSHSADPFLPEQVELAAALAKQVSLAIQLAKLSEQSRSAAVLTERNRLAQEIHDTLAQTLTGISLQADVAQRIVNQQPTEASKLIGQVAESARQGLVEAKRSVWELQPELRGLSQALSNHLQQIVAGTDIQTELQIQGETRAFAPEVSFNLLRIGQEAIANSLKHAQAKTIWVDLIFAEEQFQLRVRDDGQGFDVEKLGNHDGFGLIAMKQRAEKLRGNLQINSQPGQGTEIIVEVLGQ